MSEQGATPENKTCVACFNAIDRRATRCPHCQSYQGLRRTVVFAAAIGASVLLLGLFAGAFLTEYGLARRVFEDNSNYADQVAIQSSQMFLSPPKSYDSQNGKIISVVGRLTNQGPKVLRSMRLQVAVQTADGQLIDTFEGTVTGPLNPGDSMTFRIDSYNRIHLPESEYRKHMITVRQASPT